MKKLALIISLCLSLFGLNFDEIKSNIKTQNISGNFTQTKILFGFSGEFKSFGSFSLGKNELIWHSKKPIVSEVVINQDGIFQKSPNGLSKITQKFDEKLFLALISLDEVELKKQFEYEISGDKESWKITLSPKNLILKQIFKQIIISGDSFIRRLELIEVSSDKTVNEFYDIR